MRRVAVLASFLALAGCSGESSPDTEPLTAAQWRREASDLCVDIGRRVRAFPEPRAEDEILEFTAAVTPLWKREEEGIRALMPPPELAPLAEVLADALEEVSVSLLETHIAMERGDSARLSDAIERGQSASRTVKLRALDLRLPACAAQRIP